MNRKGIVIGVLAVLFATAGAWLYLTRDPDPQDTLQWHFENACHEGNLSAVKRLFEMGAKPNYISQREDVTGSPTALYDAAQRGQDDVVRFLIEHGADANLGTMGGLGGTPLWVAIENQHYSTAELLLNAGAHVNDARDDDDEIDPKDWKYGQRMLDLLEKHGAKIKKH